MFGLARPWHAAQSRRVSSQSELDYSLACNGREPSGIQPQRRLRRRVHVALPQLTRGDAHGLARLEARGRTRVAGCRSNGAKVIASLKLDECGGGGGRSRGGGLLCPAALLAGLCALGRAAVELKRRHRAVNTLPAAAARALALTRAVAAV